MSKKRREFAVPPPVGATRYLASVLPALDQYPYMFDTLEGRKPGRLSEDTTVVITSHTRGHEPHYGPGCYVTPVIQTHKWYGRHFYVSNRELQFLVEL